VRAVVVLATLVLAGTAAADDSKLAKEDVPLQNTVVLHGKDKTCCGYPLVDELQWALRFYWLAFEDDYDGAPQPSFQKNGNLQKISPTTWVELYTPEGYYFGHVPERFAWSLRLEGSGIMRDGRVINYTGSCRFGYGTCFEQLDVAEHPFGRGNKGRPLIPFKSVAIDPRLVPIGEPLYIPEFDGMVLPDGSIHDGCVRADDTGGGIKKRKMDFFVVTYGNFRFLLEELLNVTWITPHIQAPRCAYLRDQ
jgi:3D (Asp-Asp-Asp) domain-containing protein